MSRFQLSLNVDDVDAAVEFYRTLLGVEPAKHRPGYANFVVEDPPMKLIVIEGEGEVGTINHVGIEYADGAEVARETQRITDAGLPVMVDDPHTCCYATQEKAWTRGPDGVPWELYTVTAEQEHFGANQHHALDELLPPVDDDAMRAAIDDAAVTIIDAQGPGGWERAHLDGAVDFALDDVAGQAAATITDRHDPIVLYCTDADCVGSEFIGTQLVDLGYTNVRRYAPGVAGLIEAGAPVVTTAAVDEPIG